MPEPYTCPNCGQGLCAGTEWSGNPSDGPDYVNYCPDPDCGYWKYV